MQVLLPVHFVSAGSKKVAGEKRSSRSCRGSDQEPQTGEWRLRRPGQSPEEGKHPFVFFFLSELKRKQPRVVKYSQCVLPVSVISSLNERLRFFELRYRYVGKT